jgi:hypothetical protein
MSNGMTTAFCVLFALVACMHADAQTAPPALTESKFVGCYDVVLLSSVPPDLPMGGIPPRFELTDRPTVFGSHVFQLEAATATSAPERLHHVWSLLHDKVKVQFGSGMGGWKGTLNRSDTNGLAGKLQPFCDTMRCGGPKQVVTIRTTRVECPK